MTAGQLLALFGVWTVAVASPGPDVAVVLQRALAGRRRGLATAAGVVAGLAVWIVAAFAGLATLVRLHPGLMTGLQVAGGLLLAALGALGLHARWRSRAPRPHHDEDGPAATPDGADDGAADDGGTVASSSSPRGDLLRGLLTNLANPKALVFFGAVLAPFVSGEESVARSAAVVAGMLAVAFAWFGGLAVAASHPGVHARIGRWLPWIDTVVSAVFVAVGVVFVVAALA